MKELTHASVAELSALLSKKEVSAKEIAQAYLDKIEDKKSLNAFLDVRPEVTLKEAEAADRKIAEGTASPLTGVPIAHKDIFVTRNSVSYTHLLRSPTGDEVSFLSFGIAARTVVNKGLPFFHLPEAICARVIRSTFTRAVPFPA